MSCPRFSSRFSRPLRRARGGAGRALLAVALAASATLGACASLDGRPVIGAQADAPSDGRAEPPAPAATHAGQSPASSDLPVATPRRADAQRGLRQYGIGVLAPALPLPVAPETPLASRELPPDLCDQDDDVGLLCAASMPPDPALDAATDFPAYAFEPSESDLRVGPPVTVMTGVTPPRRRWFSSVSSQEGLFYGDRSWTYREAGGTSLSLGNITPGAPAWGSAAPIGGVRFASSIPVSASLLGEGQLSYSSSFGRLNGMDPNATSGAVAYGAAAGSSMVSYGLTPNLTVESQMQSARDLSARGLGTTYSAGELGTFQAGVTHSRLDAVDASRYRLGYNVNVANDVKLGLTTERVQAGFGDLSSYQSGTASPYTRNIWSAGVPISGYGTLTGTYSAGMGADPATDERRFGLQHSMELAPQVRFAVGADRDVVSGSYDVRANLSLPFDPVVFGRWLGR